MANENLKVTPFPEDREILGTWVFNETINVSSNDYGEFNINFSCNSLNFDSFKIENFKAVNQIIYLKNDNRTVAWGEDNPSNNGWFNNQYKTITITKVPNIEPIVPFFNWLKQNATKQEGGGVIMPNKAISLENLKAFKQECDKTYASKEEIITVTVDCSHQYEITGNTGDEHGLAIDDQQMLIKKIQGHTRRKSLNLIKDKTEYVGTVQFSISKSVLTINGTTNLDVTWFGVPVDFLPTNFVFSTFNTSAVNDCDILFMRSGTPIDYISNVPTNSVKKISNIESISIRLNGNGKVFDNVKIPIMINEGTTELPFQPCDNTLINSHNELISTGRNLVDIYNYSEIESGVSLSENNTISIKTTSNTTIGDFHIWFYDKDRKFITGNDTGVQKKYTIPTNASLMALGLSSNKEDKKLFLKVEYLVGLTIYISYNYVTHVANNMVVSNVMISAVDNTSFEPYKEDTITTIGSLGEYDYILPQSNQRVRQTSQVVTLNGSEEWRYETHNKIPNFYVFLDFSNSTNFYEVICVTNSVLTETTCNDLYNGSDNSIAVGYKGVYITNTAFTTVDQLKQWLKANPIQLVYKLETPKIENYTMPSGYAVYNGGMQIQQGDIPYTITKQYNLSQKSQILANIEIDREQAKMIDENNQKFNLIPKFSHVDINLPETSMNGTLTEEEFRILQANDLNYIMFNKEVYMLSDKAHTIDTLTYSHVGYENHKHMLKTISVTVSTRAWILNTTEITSMGVTSVTINQPSTATNGTLTQEQINKLQVNDLNYIIFANEIYSLNDKTHTADTLTYSHVGFENGKHLLKTISITVSTRAWVLNTTSVVDSYEYRMFKINNPSGNMSTSIKEIYIYTNKFNTASDFQNFLRSAYDSDMNFAFSCVAITPADDIINAQFFYDLNIDPSSYFVIFNGKTEYVAHQNLVVVESA